MVLPLSFFLSCAASADVIDDDVARTYSRVAVRDGEGAGT